MIRSDFYKAVPFFVLLYAAISVSAQNKTVVRASVDKSKILIGEQIRLQLEADIPENEPIRFFTIDTLAHFEILNRAVIDTSNTDNGTFLKQAVVITSFDSGHWIIPALKLGDNAITDSITVDVSFSPMDTAQAYHDIKDIIAVNPKKEKNRWWLWCAIGGGLVLLGLLLFYALRKKKPVPVAAAPALNPYEEAIKQLDKLQQEKPEQKQYYSLLVDIFRVYVYRKKDIQSLQKTTDDLVVQLRSLDLPKQEFEKLTQVLLLSDFVKFAKYVPSPEDNRNSFDVIKSSINTIEKLNVNPSLQV